jgi:hypothetical protein
MFSNALAEIREETADAPETLDPQLCFEPDQEMTAAGFLVNQPAVYVVRPFQDLQAVAVE